MTSSSQCSTMSGPRTTSGLWRLVMFVPPPSTTSNTTQLWCMLCSLSIIGGVGDGRTGGTSPPPKKKRKNREKYFSGNYHVKCGHFVNFHIYIFGKKCRAPKVDWAPTPMVSICQRETRYGICVLSAAYGVINDDDDDSPMINWC